MRLRYADYETMEGDDMNHINTTEKTEFDPELAKKALEVIEFLSMHEAQFDNETREDCYRFSHIGRGGCVVHQKWVDKLNFMHSHLIGKNTVKE